MDRLYQGKLFPHLVDSNAGERKTMSESITGGLQSYRKKPFGLFLHTARSRMFAKCCTVVATPAEECGLGVLRRQWKALQWWRWGRQGRESGFLENETGADVMANFGSRQK